MKYGLTVPNRGPLATPEALGSLARHGEELGFDSVQTGDHIVVPNSIASRYPYSQGGEFPGGELGESMEQLTLLSFLAGQTTRIRLVTSVIIVPHRNPLVAAKVLATLDILSGGRLIVGVGAGWMKEEFEALGLPPFEERGAVTDEYIRAYKELWTSDNPSFEGVRIAGSRTCHRCPTRSRSPTRPSGSEARAPGPYAGPRSWETAGTPSARTPSSPWARPMSWPTV